MQVNHNIVPRALTPQEQARRAAGDYDSFANYLVFCPACGHMAKTNVYIMRAEAYRDELLAAGRRCPVCGGLKWTVGYPANSENGFVPFGD